MLFVIAEKLWHPERSEEPVVRRKEQVLRYAQDDKERKVPLVCCSTTFNPGC